MGKKRLLLPSLTWISAGYNSRQRVNTVHRQHVRQIFHSIFEYNFENNWENGAKRRRKRYIVRGCLMARKQPDSRFWGLPVTRCVHLACWPVYVCRTAGRIFSLSFSANFLSQIYSDNVITLGQMLKVKGGIVHVSIHTKSVGYSINHEWDEEEKQ